MRVIIALAMTAAVAQAQPVPCEPCARGAEHLEALGQAGATLREHLADLATAARLDVERRPLTPARQEDLERWLEEITPDLRAAMASLADQSDVELLEIGFALCDPPDSSCAVHLAAVLRCASGGCKVSPAI